MPTFSEEGFSFLWVMRRSTFLLIRRIPFCPGGDRDKKVGVSAVAAESTTMCSQ